MMDETTTASPAAPSSVPQPTRISRYRTISSSGLPLFWIAAGALLAIGFGGELTASLAGASGVAWRLGALFFLVMAVASQPNWPAFFTYAAIFSPWLLSCVINTLLMAEADRTVDYLADLARQLFIVAIGSAVYAGAANPALRAKMSVALMATAAVTALLSFTVALPFLQHGWSWSAVYAAKNDMIGQTGFGTNAVSFAGVVSAIGAYRLGQSNKVVLALLAAVLLLSVLLTARAAVAFFIIGVIAAWVISRLPITRAPRPAWAFTVPFLLIGTIVGLLLINVGTIAQSAIAKELAGRGALWEIGLSAMRGHEVSGRGIRSFTEAIRSNLGAGDFTTPYERNAIYSLQGGGFHNTWISTLVERGIVGELGLWLSTSLLFARALLNGRARPRWERFLLLALPCFLFFRSFVEINGLMSYADGAPDAVVAVALALRLGTVVPQEVRSRRTTMRVPGRRPAGVAAARDADRAEAT